MPYVFNFFFIKEALWLEDNKDLIHLVLKDGTVVIETRPDLAPKHVNKLNNLLMKKNMMELYFIVL